MDHTSITDSFGTIYIDPSEATIKSLLGSLFDKATEVCPHKDVAISHYKSGYSLVYYDNKIITLENLNVPDPSIQFIRNISLKSATELFSALNKNQIDSIINQPWIAQAP